MSSEEDKIYEDLVYVEAKLLEQEHRPTHLVLNFWHRKTTWPDPKDPRRKATQKAIIWRLFFSPAVMAAGGGFLVTAVTIFFLSNQNKIITKQNELITEQNAKIEIQANLEEAGRRNNLVLLMDNILQQVGAELKNSKDSTLSQPLIARIQALAQGFQPYKFLDYDLKDEEGNDSLGLTRQYSPERGQLLLALVKSPINRGTMGTIFFTVNFENSYLKNAKLANADIYNTSLKNTNFSGASLFYSNLSNSNLSGSSLIKVNLNNSNLANCIFKNTDLRRAFLANSNLRMADLSNADLREAYISGSNLKGINLSGADLRDTSINHVIVDRPNWLIYIRDSLKVRGADVLAKEYYVSPWNEEKGGYLIKTKE